MSNATILAENTLAGFSDGAQKLYLDLMDKYRGWSDRAGERRAFFEAYRYERLVGRTVAYILRNAPTIQQGPHIVKLERFLADRWRHNFMGKPGTDGDAA